MDKRVLLAIAAILLIGLAFGGAFAMGLFDDAPTPPLSQEPEPNTKTDSPRKTDRPKRTGRLKTEAISWSCGGSNPRPLECDLAFENRQT